MLHYQKGVVVLFEDSPELDGGEGPPHYQLDRAAVELAEDARADDGNEDEPELLQLGLPLKTWASISSGATSTLSVSGSRETDWEIESAVEGETNALGLDQIKNYLSLKSWYVFSSPRIVRLI